jgi:hypothetical protein
VSTGRINNFCRVSLLDMDRAESRARRGKSLIKSTGGLVYNGVCFVKRSLESSTMTTMRDVSYVRS